MRNSTEKDRAAIRYWAPVGLALVVVLLARSLVAGYELYLLNAVALAAMGSMAMNLLTGVAGQVSIGNAALIGIGALTAVVASARGVPFVAVLIMAALVATILGTIAGLPSLRVRGLYLMLSTLALHYIFNFVIGEYQAGTSGAGGFPIPAASLFGWKILTMSDWYILLSTSCLLTWMVLRNLMLSKSGRAWLTIRDNESVAVGLGLPVARYKLSAFALSSAILGLQGGLTAYFVGFVTADQWTLALAISYVAMIVLGGLGSITGSIAGAAIVVLLPTWIGGVLATASGLPSAITNNAGPLTAFVYGLLIILVLMLAPTGMAGAVSRIYDPIKRKGLRWWRY